ncbi:hypothetical protein BDZ45DRAFT_670457 [Acephala macrosclerotiorum]|nr:hypothetical protein BDZ45DRAFT_670457 [Acephala macrosclerotiorum]
MKTYKASNKLIDGIEKNKKLGRKGMAVISCSDPRIYPVQYLGLDFGEAAIIRMRVEEHWM